MKWVLEELLSKMSNTRKILSPLLIAVLVSACGQSGPLYMPGQATGVHKKDVFLLNSDGSKVDTSATKEDAPDKTEDKTKPPADATQTATPAVADTEPQVGVGTEQNKPNN